MRLVVAQYADPGAERERDVGAGAAWTHDRDVGDVAGFVDAEIQRAVGHHGAVPRRAAPA